MNPFAEYRITSQYGWRDSPTTSKKVKEFHAGIDLVKADKSPIYAFVEGNVLYAGEGITGSGFGGYGNVVAILDRNGRLHCYCHLDIIVVKIGQTVERNQMIGRQGNTGNSTGSHLHYEVRKASSPSYGWVSDKEKMCFEPTQYLKDYYEKEEKKVAKHNPIITKERIRTVNGGLEYIDLGKSGAYGVKATDIRFVRFDKNRVRFKFVAEPNLKVSTAVIKYGADAGFNLPYFSAEKKVPTGMIWSEGKYINGPYGAAVNYYEVGFKDGTATYGKFDNPTREQFDFSVSLDPPLVMGGKVVAKNDGQLCQRINIGVDIDGNVLLSWTDGRTGSDQGCTHTECGLYMLGKGAVWAIGGDGGHSVSFYSRLGGFYSPYNLKYDAGGLGQAENIGTREETVHHAVLVYYLEDGEEKPKYKDSDPVTVGMLKEFGLLRG